MISRYARRPAQASRTASVSHRNRGSLSIGITCVNSTPSATKFSMTSRTRELFVPPASTLRNFMSSVKFGDRSVPPCLLLTKYEARLLGRIAVRTLFPTGDTAKSPVTLVR